MWAGLSVIAVNIRTCWHHGPLVRFVNTLSCLRQPARVYWREEAWIHHGHSLRPVCIIRKRRLWSYGVRVSSVLSLALVYAPSLQKCHSIIRSRFVARCHVARLVKTGKVLASLPCLLICLACFACHSHEWAGSVLQGERPHCSPQKKCSHWPRCRPPLSWIHHKNTLLFFFPCLCCGHVRWSVIRFEQSCLLLHTVRLLDRAQATYESHKQDYWSCIA